MNTNLVILRNGQPLFEYAIKAQQEGSGLVNQAKLALAVFRHLNPTVSLFDPDILIRFEETE